MRIKTIVIGWLHYDCDVSSDVIIDNTTVMYVEAQRSRVASAISLTADKIKKDVTILGVTGTYEGSSSSDNVEMNTTFTSTNNTVIKNITKIDSLDFSNLTSILGMFEGFVSLSEIGSMSTSTITSMRNLFLNCESLETLPSFNTSSVTDMYQMFSGCKTLATIPQLNTSNCQMFGFMFSGCKKLKNIPSLDLGKATNFFFMFTGCTDLTNTDLNTIMGMCLNVNSNYSGNKTLKEIGLSSTQATTCQSLSNWSALSSAGWTTGF